MIKYFVYKGCFIDEVDMNTFNQGGVIAAGSYGDAMARIERYYGPDYIMCINELMEICDDPVVLPYEVIDNIVKEEYVNYEEDV